MSYGRTSELLEYVRKHGYRQSAANLGITIGVLRGRLRRSHPDGWPKIRSGTYAGILQGLRRLCEEQYLEQGLTLQEIADGCGVSKEEIRRIEQQALRKLRQLVAIRYPEIQEELHALTQDRPSVSPSPIHQNNA